MTPARAKKALLDRLAQLGGRLAERPAIDTEAREPLDDAVLLRGRLALEVKDIRAALARIEQDVYGTCALCEDPIPARRLEIRPESIYCVRCAEQLEKRAPNVLIADAGDDQC